jgi:uncharacterized membrane protein YidH (DUF202 family)
MNQTKIKEVGVMVTYIALLAAIWTQYAQDTKKSKKNGEPNNNSELVFSIMLTIVCTIGTGLFVAK